MSDHSSSIGGFFGRMGKSAINENFYKSVGALFGKKDAEAGHEEEVDKARAVTSDEQMWLEGQLDGNGRVDEFDQALLEFLAEESGFSR